MSEAIRYAIPETLAAMRQPGHYVIEASAGTGKTYLIEHRVVDLLLRTGCSIDQLLIVTFTEKATAELRLRIRRLLDTVIACREHTAEPEQPHWLIDDDARNRLTAALLDFDAAAIHTIHAFCQRVLVDNAFDNRRLFDQSQVASQTAFAAAFRSALREQFANRRPYRDYLGAWLRSQKSVDDLERLLYRCHQQPGELTPRFDADALRAGLDAAAGELRIDDGFAEAVSDAGLPSVSVRKLRRCAGAIAELVAAYAEHRDVARFIDAVQRVERGCVPYVRDKLGRLDIADDDARASARALLDLTADLVPLEAAVAQVFLPEVDARMANAKAARGLFDFDDMLRLVWLGLSGNGGAALAARLRQRYHHALIDEFQDTDELQWKIFHRLYLTTPVDPEQPRTLSIIGDPKQAIYSFRGADVITYLRARDEIVAAGGGLVRLQRNFRSTPEHVRANHVLMGQADAAFFDGRIEYDAEVVAATDLRAQDAAGETVAPIQLVEVSGDDKLDAASLRRRLAAYIRAEIAALLGDPQRALRVVDGEGEGETVEARDIFVLTRSTAEADHIASELRAAGIPCALYKQEGLFQTNEAREVRDLLAGIAAPRDRSARFRAWQTRFFDISLADLPALAELPETHPLAARLYEWKALATRLSYEQLFSRIIADSGIVERELFLQPSERSLTNYLHLFELLLEQVVESRCELHELVNRLQGWIDDLYETSADARNIQRLDSDRSAVQIMTVHKAKGLEAKVVFLFGGYGKGGMGDVNVYHHQARRRVHIGRAADDIKGAIEAEARAEDQRLLYVALTRAVARTYLPVIAPGTLERRMGFYDQLNRRLIAVAAAVARKDAQVEGLFSIERISATAPRASRAAWVKPSIEAWEPPSGLLRDPARDDRYERCRELRRGFEVTSYTRLKRSSAAPVDASEFKHDITSAPVELGEDELPGGAATGVFLHHVLEHLPLASAVDTPELDAWRQRDDVAAVFDDSMLRHGQDDRYRAHAEALVFGAITSPIELGDATLPGVAHCDADLREVEFLYPMADSDVLVKGFIDLVFRWQDRVYLLDWKSDVLASYDAAALRRHTNEHYAVQAQLYTTALAKMVAATDARSYGQRVGGVIYTFLRGGCHHFEQLDYEQLAASAGVLGRRRR